LRPLAHCLPAPGWYVWSRPYFPNLVPGISQDYIGRCGKRGYLSRAKRGSQCCEGIPETKSLAYGWSEKDVERIQRPEVRTKPEAGDCHRVDFHLSEAFLFSFSVKNVRSQVISQARAYGGGGQGDEEGFTGLGDERGVVRFAIPPEAGPFDCTVWATGYRKKSIPLDPHAPPAEVILEDQEKTGGEVFRGRVIDESDEPVEGAKLKELGGGTAGTDKDGRFSIKVSSETLSGSRITVSKSGYITQTVIPGYIGQPGGYLDGKFPFSDKGLTPTRSDGDRDRSSDSGLLCHAEKSARYG
jgi:ribosomal protein L37E